MSITKVLSVFCEGTKPDGEPCPHWTLEEANVSTTKVRLLARMRGWSRVRLAGKWADLCPDCMRDLSGVCRRAKQREEV